MESLARLRERRAFECRLTPDRALRSFDEATAFLRERGMLTRTTDCALPSLYEACHEEPYQPGSPGFATWPATKWPWFGELSERGYLCVAVHRGKNLLVSDETAALLDPVCRAETDRMRAADPGWRRLLDHLAMTGPSNLEDLRTELGLKRQELKALRSPLQRCGVIVARSEAVTAGEGHLHMTELSRWDQAYPGTPSAGQTDPAAALGDLLVAAVRAASPGSGTGTTPRSTTSSGSAASVGSTAMSPPASRSGRGRVDEAGVVLGREDDPGLPRREQHPLAGRQDERRAAIGVRTRPADVKRAPVP